MRQGATMKENLLQIRAELLKTLGQPTRLRILEFLKDSERCVCEIMPAIDEQQSNTSRHLSIMKQAGLLVCRQQGKSIYYRVKDRRIFSLLKLLDEIIKQQIDEKARVAAHLK